MKRLLRRLTAGILCAVLIVLTACSGKDSKGSDAKENEKGRYIETEYALPDQVGNVNAIGKLEDGTLRLVSDTGVYDSADGGASWEPAMNGFKPAVERENGSYLMDAAVDAGGRLFLAYTGGYYLIDAEGKEIPVTIDLPAGAHQGFTTMMNGEESEENEEQNLLDNALINVKFTGDGKLIGIDYSGMAYLVNPETGEVIQSFGSEDSYIEDFTVVGNRLVTTEFEGIAIYNLETGAIDEVDAALSDYFKETGADDGAVSQHGASNLTSGDTKDTIYYSDSTGLYRYTFGAGEMERLINGALCSMSNPVLSVNAIFETDDNTFLILYQGDQGNLLMHYEYSAEASAVPSHEIKVYALEDHQAIRQAISNFQTSNPDYYVNLEIGMNGDDSITASDALSTLNTNIMAGDGPDVILLDQLPIDSYIEKGLLEDLSDIAEECRKDSTFFDNILNYKESDDGIYAVPTRFSLPLAAGSDETLGNITDLASLAGEVKRLRSENADIGSILGAESAASLLEILLNTSLSNIVKEDGTLDQKALVNFLTAAKEIYDANYQPDNDTEMNQISMSGMSTDILKNFMTIVNKDQLMNIGNLDGLSGLGSLVSVNDQAGWTYKVLAGLSKDVFIPQDTVGISAKSGEKEAAAEFIKYLLSTENQSNTQASGFPVNADGLEQAHESLKNQEAGEIAIGLAKEDGTMDTASLTLRNANDDEFNAVKDYIAAADTAAVSDAVITEAIVGEGSTCLMEGADIDAAAEKILQSVNLYLSE